MSEVIDETIVDLEERVMVDVDRISESISSVLEETYGESATDITTGVTYDGIDPENPDLMRLETVTTYRMVEPAEAEDDE